MSTYLYYLTCTLLIDSLRFEAVSNRLEISLPCVNCQRDYRTILFKGTGKEGICTPSEKCSGFRGTLLEKKIDRLADAVAVKYLVEFEYEPFKDKQLCKETVLGKYGWARISFSASCAQCGEEGLFSTQENMVRPYDHKCSCGHIIMTERESPFTYVNSPKQKTTT